MPDSQTRPADLPGWLSYLEQLHPKPISLGLERVGSVAARLGLQPDFPLVMVGGTNGKGSTSAMLERIYLEAGYRVACYTSPHLLRYNERVRLDGIEMGDADLCRAFNVVEQARAEVALTYFEFGTLAAMWLFAQQSVDVAILEIGLGGRLDAVNIFEPACAIVTSVDLDHQEFLGHDRESIGREKAGIYRTGIPAICGEPEPPESLVSHAAAIGADLRRIGADFSFIPHAGGAEFRSGSLRLQDLPLPALSGSFQCGNAACALEAIHVMQPRLPVEVAAIRRGLSGVRLSGRFQRFRGPPEVIVDVAHNPHAAHALSGNLRNQPGTGRTLAVFGMLADKDIAGVVEALAQDIDAWFLAGIAQPRGATAGMLAEAIRGVHAGARLHCYPEVIAALHAACLQAGENDRIIAFGSFYTVADVMRELKDSPPCNQDKN